MNKNIIIVGGGTGGHVFPGLALYQELTRRIGRKNVQFLCTKRSVDQYVMSEWKVNRFTLSIRQPPGNLYETVPFSWCFGKSLYNTFRLINRNNPSAVVGVGGYGTIPGIIAARFLRIPLYLLEQNVIPGRTVRYFKNYAHMIFTSWNATEAHLSPKTTCRSVGNPLRREIHTAPQKTVARRQLSIADDRDVMLIMGGSQGARSINDWILSAIKSSRIDPQNMVFIHVTGPDQQDQVEKTYRRCNVLHRTYSFYPHMEQLYAASDMVVSRAGGTTLSELIHLEKPMILIPYPHALDNHQQQNAEIVCQKGGGIRLNETELSTEVFQNTVISLLNNSKKREEMENNLKELQKENTTEQIIEVLLSERNQAQECHHR